MVIKFYASLRESIGDEVVVDFKDGRSAQDLLDELKMLFPVAAEVIQVSRLALDTEILMEDSKLNSGDIVHVLPPASGG